MNNLDTVTLDNGLKIYLYNDNRRHSTFVQFTTMCGGMTKHFKSNGVEYNLCDGVAHILEHYIVECNEMGNFLNLLGEHYMNTNASTHFKHTSFYFEAVEDVEFGIETLLKGINNVTFDEKKLKKLKNPIYQEIRGKLDSKYYHLNRMKFKNLFNNSDFRDIGGLIEEVEGITIEDIKMLYESFYRPSNQFIVIAGNFNKDIILKIINDFYKNYKYSNTSVELIDEKDTLSVKKKSDILYFPTPIEYCELSFKIDISKYSANELLDLDFYLNCFYGCSFGITSPLYKKMVNEKIITDKIYVNHCIINNFLIISIMADTDHYVKFKKMVLDELSNINSLNKEKFELDIKTSIINLILRDENIYRKIMPFIENIITYNYPYLDEVKDIERLNYRDFNKYIKGLDFSNYIELIVKDKKKES